MKTTILLASCLLLTGCGGGSGSSGPAPSLRSITPTSGPLYTTTMTISGSYLNDPTAQVLIGGFVAGNPVGANNAVSLYPIRGGSGDATTLEVTTTTLYSLAPGTYPVVVKINNVAVAQPIPPLTFTVTSAGN